jgi:Subtilase family
MDRKLPVKFFEKRTNDLLRTEAGPPSLPKWILQGKELVEKSEAVAISLDVIAEQFAGDDTPAFVPVIIKVELGEGAKAKSHKKEVSNFFKVSDNTGEIGLYGDNQLLIKVGSLDTLKQIRDRATNYVKHSYALSAMVDVNPFMTEVETSHEGNVYKIKLFNYQSYETNKAVKQYVMSKLNELKVVFKEVQYAKNLVIFKVNDVSLDQLQMIESLPIRSIVSMPKYDVNEVLSVDGMQELVKLEFDPHKQYPKIGILDSGIERNMYNEDWIIRREEFYLDEDIDTNHGTFVSGIVLYGDQLENKVYTGINGCRILDVPILSAGTDEDELISNIRRAISNNRDIKIWNLSVSVQREVDNENFSDIAIALDQMQDEFDVIICKSAGNSKAFLNGFPKERIHTPAESVRALTVGSIQQEDDYTGYSKKDEPTPYTRIGRGPAQIVKPEVVHYGGDVWKDPNGNFVMKGVRSLTPNGDVKNDCGTSFSTPRISSILAGLENEIEEEFDALTLRALVIHSANYGACGEMDAADKLAQLGFGRPKNMRDILYNDEYEITLVLRDTLDKSRYVDIMDFPFPQELSEEGFFRGQITVTLVYNPILSPDQGSEYCQSNIDVKLGTYGEKVNRDMEKRNILNPMGRKDSKNVLNPSLYSKRVDYSAENPFSTERMLINFGDKYYPVKKYSVDLSEFTPSNKEKFLSDDKKWYLNITGLYRDFIEKQAEKNDEKLSMDYCVIISIKDPRKETDVYTEVVQGLDYNNFYHRDINVTQDISITIED